MTNKEVMQMALDAFETHAKQYPHMVKGYTVDAAQALRAALAQPEPEPALRGTDYEAAFYKDWNAGKVRRVSDGKRMVPEREWVGLTDEEILDLADMAYANDLELLQTLQAKLKEKNA
jgi:hypothetical protein